MTESANSGWISRSPGQQAESVVHYPHALQSGWLPKLRESLQAFHRMILDAERTKYAPSVAELDRFIDDHEVIRYLVNNACRENLNLVETYPTTSSTGGVAIPRIKDKETLLHGFNTILKHPPFFVNDELVGLPFSAWVVGIDPTLSGVALFGLPMFNRKMSAVLREWFELPRHTSVCRRVHRGRQTVAIAAGKVPVPIRRLEERPGQASVLDIVELVFYASVQGSGQAAADRRSRLQPNGDCGQRRLTVPLGLQHRQSRRVLVQGHGLLARRHPETRRSRSSRISSTSTIW